MSDDELFAEVRRTLAHTKAGTTPHEPAQLRVPVGHYTDPDRWALEMDRIFRRVPLLLAFSAEMAKPFAYKALDVMGVPVLLTRDADGRVHSFVNMCRHRGAQVVEVGTGTARRHACPYHAWTYDSEGELVGIFERADFGEVDQSCHALVPLPVEERAGLIFGCVVPGADLNLDDFLCGYDRMLAHHDLASCHVVGRQQVSGPNWKVAYDGYLDFYHLPILHRTTFGSDYPNKGCADVWGPHQRLTQQEGRVKELLGVPEEAWSRDILLSGVWTIFPNVSIASFRTGGGRIYQVAQLMPGSTWDASTTTLTWLAVDEPDEAAMSEIDKQIDFLVHVVRDEDYRTGLALQQALATGAMDEVVFGLLEGNNQRFHRWVDDLVGAADPADTARLFAEATEFHHP